MSDGYVMIPIDILMDSMVSPTALRVWAYLAHRQGQNDHCWPSLERIGTDLGLSRNTCRAAITCLSTNNLIEAKKPERFGRGKATEYQIKGSKINPFSDEKGSKNDPFNNKKGSKFDKKRVKNCTPIRTSNNNHSTTGAFDRFWSSWPKKVAKAAAKKAWAKLSPDEVLLEQILEALDRQKRSDQWTRDGGQYIPYPATWLRGRRWEDETPTQPGKIDLTDPETWGVTEAEARAALGLLQETTP